MNTTDTTGLQSDIDVDDVEAHGIREVMVGLSAAAVLTGGVAAVVNAGDGPGSSDRASITADAKAGDLADANFTTADLAGTSVAIGGTSVDAANAAADAATDVLGTKLSGSRASTADAAADVDEATERSSYLGSRLDRADALLDRSVDWARDVRDDSIDTARDAVETSRTTVRETRSTVRNAPQTAMTAARETVGTVRDLQKDVVDNTVERLDATIVLVGDAVRGVEGTVNTVVAQIQPGVGSDFDASTASGWVTISVGGQELARAQVTEGQATLSYQVPSADVPLTVTFAGGDLIHAPAITL